ncbi:MAG: hypothetical protein IJJ90_06330 [Prevotella sp.]|nr:hypothetical protein [Prevotella sp.]MBQ6423143.1 hypothetical protein [Prevotella sp.]
MMKNLALFLLFVATAASTNAQTTPSVTPAGEGELITRFDVTYANRLYETSIWKAEGHSGAWSSDNQMGILGDCSPEVIVNPDKTGINKNDKCLKLTVGADGYDNFKMYLPWNDSDNNRFNLYGRRRISLLYKPGDGSTDFNVNLELHHVDGTTEENYTLKLGAWYDAGGGWKRMYFNFEPYEIANTSHPTINDYPNFLVFDAKTKTGSDYHDVSYSEGQVFYIDDIKVEDEPYADGIWIDSFGNKHDRWVTAYNASTAHQEFPHTGNNGVVYLSGTWLKGENIVNPDIQEEDVDGQKVKRWVFVYNEFRDLSWHVKPGEVKYYVFQCDDSENNKISKLRMPDRGAMVGMTTADERTKYGYGERFIDNKNVLVFAESCGGYEDNWYDTNVAYYKGSDTWEAKDLELTDAYEFVNPIEFTAKEKVMVTRRMENGFNTVVYPFSLSASDICSSRVGIFYHHNDESTVYFIPTRSTQANVPFVTEGFTSTFVEGGTNVTNTFQQFVGERTIAVVDPNQTYVATEQAPDYIPSQKDDAGYKFVGTYKRISGEGLWGIATVDGTQSLKQGTATSAFKPFRAYLDLNGSLAPARYSTLSISDYEDLNPTGIDAVEIPVDAQSGTADVYSLSGVRIASAATPAAICQLPQGVYIVNGKKMFIK